VIPCKLVHDTGTMIRFRTSQLAELPAASADIQILLPAGRLVKCHFNRHPQNPNVSGADVVRYIKQRIGFKEREDVLVEQRTTTLWAVHLLDGVVAVAREARVSVDRVRGGALQPQDLGCLMALADRENDRGRRIQTYQRVLRPAGLRRLMVELVGARCMAQGCAVCEQFDAEWGNGSGAVIADVHHIEPMARTIDHHPRNLCILCGNHHRFVHGSGSWSVRHDGPNVILARGTREMVINRPDIFIAA